VWREENAESATNKLIKTRITQTNRVVGNWTAYFTERLRLLGKHGFPFRAALWLYLSEAEEWRLFLAVPKVREVGRKEVLQASRNHP
jgi:hypothetical protein